MAAAAAPALALKPISMAVSRLTPHPHPHPFLAAVPSFPAPAFRLFLSSPLRKHLTLCTPLVAQTSDLAEDVGVADDVSDTEAEDVGVADDVSDTEAEGDGPPLEPESYAEPPEEAKLFVGNLPFDMDSEKLANLFDQAGVVEVAEVIYNRETDQSRGFGFVTMSTVEEAERAVEKLNRYDINGRNLTVNKAAPRGSRQPALRVYVGNLPWQIDDARLEQVFSEHGKVVDARVVYDRESGRSRGFGFVTLSSSEEVDDAIAALDGQSLDGRALRVNVAAERPPRTSF